MLKMALCVLVTVMSFPCWEPFKLALICALLFMLQLVDYSVGLWRGFAVTAAISLAMFGISMAFSEDLSSSICSAMHFTVLLLASCYMFQTSTSELLRALRSCHIPEQLFLGFLIMYRFIDVLQEELSLIWQAGTMISTNRIGPFRKLYRCMIIPFSYRMLMLSDRLALSVMSRDFGCCKRTQLSTRPIHIVDALVFFSAATLIVVIICLPLK